LNIACRHRDKNNTLRDFESRRAPKIQNFRRKEQVRTVKKVID